MAIGDELLNINDWKQLSICADKVRFTPTIAPNKALRDDLSKVAEFLRPYLDDINVPPPTGTLYLDPGYTVPEIKEPWTF